MTDEDLKLIRQIVVGGGSRYTAENVDRGKYEQLVGLGWLTAAATQRGSQSSLTSPHPIPLEGFGRSPVPVRSERTHAARRS